MGCQMLDLTEHLREFASLLGNVVHNITHWNGDISREDAIHRLRQLVDTLDDEITKASKPAELDSDDVEAPVNND